MKKVVIILIALVTLQLTAQDKKKVYQKEGQRERMETMRDLTPEEMATIQTKKMTLHLDLTKAQQQKMQAFLLDEATLRKAKMEEHKAMKENGETKAFTKEDKFKMMNERLDHQITVKQKMKSILNAEQFEKWEVSQGNMDHRGDGKRKMDKEKNKH